MSGTSLAMGRQIEEYLKSINANRRKSDKVYLSVGEVAKANECTKATARKYINMLVSAGVLDYGDCRGRGGLRKIYAFKNEVKND